MINRFTSLVVACTSVTLLSISAFAQTLTVVSGSPQNPAVVSAFNLTLSDPTGYDFDRTCDAYGCDNSYTTTIASGGYTYYTSNTVGMPLSWNNTLTFNMTEALAPPVNQGFTVTVTDSYGAYGGLHQWSCNNCFRTSNLAVTTSGVNPSCSTPGSATANVTGGLGPFTYAWTGGGTTQTINVTTPGTYTVTVTDANSVTINESVTIGGVATLAVTATGSNIDDLCAGGTATVSVDAGTGTQPFTYLWSNGATTATVSGLDPGVYTVDVTDGNSCVQSASATVAYAPTLVVESGSPQEASVNSFALELSDPTGSSFDVASNGYHVQNDYEIEITDCGGTVYYSDDIPPNTIPVPWNGMLNPTMTLVNTPPGNVMLDIRVHDNGSGGGDWICSGCFQTLAAPDNDLCADAETLECGVPTTGTTVGATDTDSPSICNAFSNDLGVWYTFMGTGGDVKLSTCGVTTTASSALPWFAVYSGDCNNLVCVGGVSGPDAECGAPNANSAAYEFTTTAGVEYYVFVTASSGAPATIDFDLTLSCVPPANDLCADAETLVCGVPTTGTTAAATGTGNPTGCNTIAGDRPAWYSFTGTGGGVEVSTCGPITGGSNASFLAVFTGPDCNALTCVEDMFSSPGSTVCGTAGSASVEFTSTAGVTYYAFVSSLNGGDIDFDITLTCDPTVGIMENDIEEINVYPNPSNGQFVVEVNGVDANAQITIMDVTGRKIYAEEVVMNKSFRKGLNLDVAKGTYLLRIGTADGFVTRKIQIQ